MTIRKTDMKHTLEVPTSLPETGFLPYNLKYEKSGTSMVHQIGDYRRQGRYSPRDAHRKRIFNDIIYQAEVGE